MITFLKQISAFINQFNSIIGRAVSWLTLLMVLLTFVIVVLRYVFSTGWIAMQESVLYMHSMVFLLAAAATLRANGHVRVDIFYQSMSIKKKYWVDIIGTVFFLFPVAGFILWSSWDYVADSWSLLEGSREAGGLPGVFLLKTCIPLMALLLILQGISELIQKSLALITPNIANQDNTEAGSL